MRDNKQADHFDQKKNRFDTSHILNPLPQHISELEVIEKALISLPTSSQLIDFGSGNGRISLNLLKRGFNVLSVDISRNSLKQLNSFYHQYKTTSWGKLSTALELPKYPFADAIVGADVLHHVEINKMLPLFKSSLKSGGILVFSEPNALHLLWYLYLIILRKIPWRIEKGILYCNYFYLKSIFRQTGFRIKIFGHGFFPTPLLNNFSFFNKLNLFWGNLPIIKLFAFRLLIEASLSLK